jgi:hypothetical protein
MSRLYLILIAPFALVLGCNSMNGAEGDNKIPDAHRVILEKAEPDLCGCPQKIGNVETIIMWSCR